MEDLNDIEEVKELVIGVIGNNEADIDVDLENILESIMEEYPSSSYVVMTDSSRFDIYGDLYLLADGMGIRTLDVVPEEFMEIDSGADVITTYDEISPDESINETFVRYCDMLIVISHTEDELTMDEVDITQLAEEEDTEIFYLN